MITTLRECEVLFMGRLRDLRKEKNLSQEELAFCLGTNQQRISKVEKENASFGIDLLLRYADYFGVTTDYLLGLSDIRVDLTIEELQIVDTNKAEVRELLYCFSQMDKKNREIIMNLAKSMSSRDN